MPKTSSELLTLWEAGTPLQQAVHVFAPKDLKADWKSARSQSSLQAIRDRVEADTATEAPVADKISRAIAEAGPILNRRADIMNRMRWNLAEALRRDLLIAVAFEFPRTLASAPVELRPEYWRGKQVWDKGELHADNLRFVEVRILMPAQAAALLGGSVEGTARKPGRPGYGPDIEAAFHALNKAGKIAPHASMSSHYPLIRDWLRAHRPDSAPTPRTPGDEAIRRVVAPLFRALTDDA